MVYKIKFNHWRNVYIGNVTYYIVDFRKIMELKIMQISQDNFYPTASAENNLDGEMERLSKNFEIHKLIELKNFLQKNAGLIQYIDRITPIINSHFPDYKKCITFCQDPEFEELDDITIYINSLKTEFDKDWKQLDKLERELFYIKDFSTEIKGLISMDLWFSVK